MSRKYRIITVENDEDERFFMKKGFDESGLFDMVAQVKNGDELFKWLDANPGIYPEVILSDLNMPGKNGYDIVAELKAQPGRDHIPVIITSTSSTKSVEEKTLAGGAAAFVVKPDTFVDYRPFALDLYNLIAAKLLP